ncbi:histone-lysine N-methyltransferase SETMAR [Trichonephila clavipes]|nr:histone-lysine N-methyltransferase SETMAR [Trichonephila clavipes]
MFPVGVAVLGGVQATRLVVVGNDFCEVTSEKSKLNGNTLATVLTGENASQVAEIANVVYGVDIVTGNYVQFGFRRFRSGIFDVKGAPQSGRFIVENVDKITEIIQADRHF